MEKKLDLRVQKTYHNLFAAMQELLCEKGLGDITVTELCDRAQTRKATFYKHFGDKTELFVFMVQEIQEEYHRSLAAKPDAYDEKSYYTKIFLYYLDFLEQHEPMVLKMMQDRSRSITFDLLSEQIQRDLTLRLHEDQKKGLSLSSSPELVAAMYTGVITYASRWWFSQKTRIPKETLAMQFDNLVRCFQNTL